MDRPVLYPNVGNAPPDKFANREIIFWLGLEKNVRVDYIQQKVR